MADTQINIRVDEEIKALFNELSEKANLPNKNDFLTRLLSLYQAETVKESEPVLRPAIEACENLITRLIDILTGVGATIATNEEKRGQELEAQRLSFEETRNLLQQRITFMEQERNESEERAALLIAERESAESKADELQQQIERLKSATTDKDALITEYKDKIDALSGIASEFRAAADERKSLVESINHYKQENEGLQRQIDEMTREQQRQAETFKAEQDNLKNSLLLQKDRELLELRQQLQAESEERQARYATQISEYQNKIESLLLERETSLSKAPSKRAPKKTAATAHSEDLNE